MNRDEELKQIFSGRYPLPLDASTKKSYKILLYRSTIKSGKIKSVSLPNLLNNYSIFSYKDLPDNTIVLEGDKQPILATEKVEYIGQPIFILTGPDLEELVKLKKRIKVEYEEIPLSKEFFYTRELKNIPINKPYKTIAGSIKTNTRPISDRYANGVFVKKESDNIIIYSYNNWGSALVDNIERICNISKDNIKIIVPFIQADPDVSIFDTFYSSLIAVIIQTKIKKNVTYDPPISEKKVFSSKYYGLSSNWQIHYNSNNEIVGTTIKVFVNCGAFPIMVIEKVSRILYGITSYYKIRNINISVEAIKSNNPPCGIFTGLYLPDAIFICETLISKIIKLTNSNQYIYRRDNLLERGYKSNTNTVIKRDLPIKNMLTQVIKESDFLRKDSSIGLIHKRKGSVLKLLPKKGVGLSVGFNGNNYITNSKNLMINSVTLNLLQGDMVVININSTVNSIEFIDIWKNIITEILDVPHENIDMETNDLSHQQSPLIENKNINIITPLIRQCCEDIKSRRFKDPLPIIQTRFTRRTSVRTWDLDSWIGTPFKSTSFGTAVIETEIDKRALEPIIKEIWLVIDIGSIIDKNSLLRNIYRDIQKTISNLLDRSNEPIYSSRKPNFKPQINISIYDSGRKKDSKALGSLISSILPSAYLQSVNQALGSNFSTLPVTREMISRELLKDVI